MSSERDFGIYFSYHQERDEDRAEIVMSHSTSRQMDVPSIWTQADWDAAIAQGQDYAEQMIIDALQGIRVTCVLIGERTVDKPWIRPMLKASHRLGKGILAVYIHNIPDYNGNLCKKGPNPMGNLKYKGRNNQEFPFSSYYFSYDWKLHDGPNRFNLWAQIANNQLSENMGT